MREKILKYIFKNQIIIVGDIHGNWKKLNQLINKKQPRYLICVGDFGYYPRLIEKINNKSIRIFDPKRIKLHGTTLYFIDGNHEDHWSLQQLDNNLKPIKISEGIYYCPRGSIFEIDNYTFYCFGGGLSRDKHLRVLGCDYFEEELPTYMEIKRALEHFGSYKTNKKRVLLTHNGAECILKDFSNYDGYDTIGKINDIFLKLLEPYYYFFGHWHLYKSGILNNIKWFCLNMIGKENNYYILKRR